MSTSAWGLLALFLGVLLLAAWPLGLWLVRISSGNLPGWVHKTEAPLYRWAGTAADRAMTWSQYAFAVLAFNALGVLVVYLLQRWQGWLPLNPAGMAAVSPDSAFNTAISFVSNTNWQGYGGESSMSYFTQMLALAVQNFLSAATGIAVAFALFRGFAARSTGVIGNFWVDVTRITAWVLLPLSLVFAVFLSGQGVVQNFDAYKEVRTLEVNHFQQPKLGANGQVLKDDKGQPVMEDAQTSTQMLAMGPVASQEAIKMIGTNGGGFFNANSAHPYENPTALTNFLQMLT
ncbi:MAG: potassium-transporting ATPase subunit KdpA, partial [Comamonadaceae bacterium]|nr:potassium-transporting ATPase subunit KdpA [Comamonadaceae bacterium]